MNAPSTEARRARIVALVPLALAPSIVALGPLAGPLDVRHFLREGGDGSWAVLGTAASAALALAVVAAWRARGASVSVAYDLAACAAPWLVGLSFMRVQVHEMLGPVGSPDYMNHYVMVQRG